MEENYFLTGLTLTLSSKYMIYGIYYLGNRYFIYLHQLLSAFVYILHLEYEYNIKILRNNKNNTNNYIDSVCRTKSVWRRQ